MKALKEIDDILANSLSVNHKVNWESLKKKEKYPEQAPSKPSPKIKKDYPTKPLKEEPIFSFTENMFKSKKELKIKEYADKYSTILTNLEKEKAAVDQQNAQLDLDFQRELKRWENEVSSWKGRKKAFPKQHEEFNINIEQMKQKYSSKKVDSILEYCDIVLDNSIYPDLEGQNLIFLQLDSVKKRVSILSVKGK